MIGFLLAESGSLTLLAVVECGREKLRPATPKSLTVESLPDALSSAGKAFPLITLHKEKIRPDVCFIGEVRQITSRSVTLFEISPQAKWEQDEKHQLRDITRIDSGGAYETLLHKLSAGN